MEPQKRVEELLVSLGSSADEVAQSLRDRGIKGTGRGPSNCPIQKLVSQELGEANISVGFEWVSAGPPGARRWAVLMPGAVQVFIVQLAVVSYKDLVQE